MASGKGYFGGHVPHDLENFANTEQGQQIIRNAIDSIIIKLKKAPEHLDGPTLDLIGIDGTFAHPFETCRLIEVGEAFIKLMDGEIDSDVRSTEFMPGSRLAT